MQSFGNVLSDSVLSNSVLASWRKFLQLLPNFCDPWLRIFLRLVVSRFFGASSTLLGHFWINLGPFG